MVHSRTHVAGSNLVADGHISHKSDASPLSQTVHDATVHAVIVNQLSKKNG